MEYTAYHLPAGTCLDGRYTIKKVIGEGGFGITYEAVNNSLGSRVAIKEFYYREFVTRNSAVSTQISISSPDRFTLYRQARDRFLREARIVSDFSGAPGIISVTDYFEANDTAYIVMKYLDGITLQQYLQKHGPFPAEEICAMMLPMLQSLEKIHNSGIIHRDISPDNIMVLSDGSLCLVDFGAARTYLQDADKSSAIITKNGYTPCEQYDQSLPQGPWNDIYALTAVLYTCITGTVPESSLQRLLLDTLKFPSELGISLSPALEAVLRRGLSVQPEKRFQSLAEFIQQLEKCLPEKEEKDRKKQRRKRIFAGACFLAVILVLSFFLFYQNHREYFPFYGEETVHFVLYPDDEMPTAEYYHAADIIDSRLKTLTDDHYLLKEESGYLRCIVPLDDCGDMNLLQFLRTYISRPGNISLDGTPLSETDLTDARILEDEAGTWISFRLNDAYMAQLIADSKEGKSHFLCLDSSYSNYFYREIQVTGEDTCRISIPGEGNLGQLMLQILTSAPSPDVLYIQYDPDVTWEDSRTSLIAGSSQVNAPDIPEPYVTCELSTYSNVNRGNWYHVLSDFKTRLDSLEIPYAFGTDTHGENHVIFRISQEDYCDTLLHILPLSSSDISFTINAQTFFASQFSMEIKKGADGSVQLLFTPASSYQTNELEKVCTPSSEETPLVYLRCGDIILASGKLTDEPRNRQICLDQFGVRERVISTDELPLFQLVQSCVYDTTMPMIYSLYSQNLSGAGEQPQKTLASRTGWNPNLENENRILEELNAQIPEMVNAEFSLDPSKYQLIVTLADTTEDLTDTKIQEIFRKILSLCADNRGQVSMINIQQRRKDSYHQIAWRFVFVYDTYDQTYRFSYNAFSEKAGAVCAQLQAYLEKEEELKDLLSSKN